MKKPQEANYARGPVDRKTVREIEALGIRTCRWCGGSGVITDLNIDPRRRGPELTPETTDDEGYTEDTPTWACGVCNGGGTSSYADRYSVKIDNALVALAKTLTNISRVIDSASKNGVTLNIDSDLVHMIAKRSTVAQQGKVIRQ